MSITEITALIQSNDYKKLREIITNRRLDNIFDSNDMNSSFLLACDEGCIECVQVFIDNNIAITEQILNTVCRNGNINMLTFLLKKSATINDTILMTIFRNLITISNAFNDIISILIDHIHDLNYNCLGNYLYHACKVGNIIITQKLLDLGAEYDNDIYHDPLIDAACEGYVDIVRLLLYYKYNNNHSLGATSTNSTATPTTAMPQAMTLERIIEALQIASKYGHLEVIQCLIEYNMYNNSGVPTLPTTTLNECLSVAIWENRLNLVEYLLKQGANVNHIQSERDFTSACDGGNPGMVQLLISYGADLNVIYPYSGKVPLHSALPFFKTVEILLEHGANPNFVNSHTGDTALMLAIYNTTIHVDVVALLLKYGADVTQVIIA